MAVGITQLLDTTSLTAAAAGITLLGVALAWRGRRGRRLDDHPLCRRCGFDLCATEASTCPECAADLRRPRAVTVGHHTPRRWMTAAGVTAALPGLLVLGLLVWVRTSGVNVQPHKPVWWLTVEALGDNAATRSAAIKELVRRQNLRLLPNSQTQSLVAHALAVQADETHPWDDGWGDLVQVARAQGRLSDGQWDQYWRQAFEWKLTPRPRVRRGDPLPVWLARGRSRHGSGNGYAAHAQFVGWRVGDMACDPTFVEAMRETLGWSPPRTRQGAYLNFDPQTLARLTEGPQTVTCALDVDVYSNGAVAPGEKPGARVRVEVMSPWVLAPATEPAAGLTTSPALADLVRQTLSVKGIVRDEGLLSLDLTVMNPPTGIAWDVFVRSEGREWPLGGVLCAQSRVVRRRVGAPVAGFDALRADIVFRPNRDIAAATVDVMDIWGEEVVLRDVPLVPAKPQDARAEGP